MDVKIFITKSFVLKHSSDTDYVICCRLQLLLDYMDFAALFVASIAVCKEMFAVVSARGHHLIPAV